MAKGDYSPHQRRLIRDYYRNRDAIDEQRLQELVTEIALAATAAKRARLWERAAELLARSPGVEETAAARIVADRDVEALARLAANRF